MPFAFSLYSTITGHFINDKWELRSIVLETKKVEGSHTAENIKGTLLEAQARWNLPTPTGEFSSPNVTMFCHKIKILI